MEKEENEDKILLPHHEQQKLCTTRLPYRQGRKLTAVKAYSITKESNHLLIFGVPSLNLRQETKALFLRFGKLLQFHISKDHTAEPFTETYHAQYDRIQSARIAKKMLDAKNFYGGSLHVCYSPELETIEETRQKLVQRQKDVLFRLRNLQKEENNKNNEVLPNVSNTDNGTEAVGKKFVNMGDVNIISVEGNIRKHKWKTESVAQKRFKPCFVEHVHNANNHNRNSDNSHNEHSNNDNIVSSNVKRNITDVTEVEIVDCTSVEQTTVSNIEEGLNYNKFGTELIYKVVEKPLNKIKFNVNKKSLICIMFYLI